MLLDLSLEVTKEHRRDTGTHEKMVQFGHLGTHFDVMNQEFPLAFSRRNAVVFDVRKIADRDITENDIDLSLTGPEMFVAFCTGMTEREPYGTRAYFSDHPQLSDSLIDRLLERGVSIIGVDCAGVRRGKEHTPKDAYCAERGVFIVENLWNLSRVLDGKSAALFTAHTYPVRFQDMTGLPCRVLAEISCIPDK